MSQILLAAIEAKLGQPLEEHKIVAGGDDSSALVVKVKDREGQGLKKLFVKYTTRDGVQEKYNLEVAGLTAIVRKRGLWRRESIRRVM